MAQFASAGNAKENVGDNPIGLYRHPDGFEVGVIDPAQGDAVIRQGFTLVEEGREAAMKAGSSKEAMKAEGRETESYSPTDTAEEAVERVPNQNVIQATPQPSVLSDKENKQAEDAKKELTETPKEEKPEESPKDKKGAK